MVCGDRNQFAAGVGVLVVDGCPLKTGESD